MKKLVVLSLLTFLCIQVMSQERLMPIMERVNVQADTARSSQVVDGEWVCVGVARDYAISHDNSILYKGKPSYRFELKEDDNTLAGYSKGSTKGRAEMSYCYAVASDYEGVSSDDYQKQQILKTVYHEGKGICEQGSAYTYRFAVYVPSDLSSEVTTIFAQWHGMPSRTLVQTPDGEIKTLTVDEFVALSDTVMFKKNVGHVKVPVMDKKGNHKRNKYGELQYKAGDPNGWLVEQGGYPPLAFGFSDGQFYIKANSDRRWLTDKDDRCNASPKRHEVLVPVTSEYKASTIAYKMPFEEFPKDCWVEFTVEIDWTVYGREKETILKPGRLDVVMQPEKGRSGHIVDNARILIGRNDDYGYYFKFGIYRVGDSTVPVSYNLAGYSQTKRSF